MHNVPDCCFCTNEVRLLKAVHWWKSDGEWLQFDDDGEHEHDECDRWQYESWAAGLSEVRLGHPRRPPREESSSQSLLNGCPRNTASADAQDEPRDSQHAADELEAVLEVLGCGDGGVERGADWAESGVKQKEESRDQDQPESGRLPHLLVRGGLEIDCVDGDGVRNGSWHPCLGCRNCWRNNGERFEQWLAVEFLSSGHLRPERRIVRKWCR